jgi:transcriptional regulator with XRE-family HTH domain
MGHAISMPLFQWAKEARVASADLGELLQSFTDEAFRLETLPRYTIEEEAEALHLFSEGKAMPMDFNKPWLDIVKGAAGTSRRFRRVRILSDPVTLYQEFEIEWGYKNSSAAGEEIGLVGAEDATSLPSVDFWLFDDSNAVRMKYDNEGRFLGTVGVSDPAEIDSYRQAKTRALELSSSLWDYLSTRRHSWYSVEPLTQYERERRELGGRLRELRAAAELTGTELARLMGISQSKLSKIETGRVSASVEDIERFADALKLPEDVRESLLDHATTILTEFNTWRVLTRRRLQRKQREVYEIELSSTEMKTFHAILIPGLLQTAE